LAASLGGSLLLACTPESAGLEQDCAQAAERLGQRACVHAVDDRDAWASLAIPSAKADEIRQTKYLFPARTDARLPALFLDANNQTYHYDLLVDGFPDTFAGMQPAEYDYATLGGEDREFFAGNVVELVVAGDTVAFGYNVWDDTNHPEWALTCEQAHQVEAFMHDRFGPAPHVFVPFSKAHRDVLSDCVTEYYDPDIGIEYEPYTVATGFGYVKRYTLPELAQAQADFEFGYRDVLVLDEAPLDIETVVSGVVTGTRQADLSHLNVRSTSRGTPNCYLQDAHNILAGWEDQLVELSCGEKGWDVRAASIDESEAFWDALRPDPVPLPAPDLEYDALVGLLDVPTADAGDRTTAIRRFGSKGSNLAILYQRIDPELSFPGFLIPFAWYDRFMSETTWTVDLGDGPSAHSFAETIDAWLDDPAFTDDGATRRDRLTQLRAAIEAADVDPALLDEIEAALLDTWGDTTTMVRFRSSSNAEDALQFNGAGLYDSTSVCLADQLDGDAVGPSLCDPAKGKERGLRRGLTRVWASLWKMGAYEEREWFGIDHRAVAMGILVNTRSKNEQANIVAFTGQPTKPDDPRWLVNAQEGELDVVGAPPGVVPERALLTIDEGAVTNIDRVSPSSEVPDGTQVLSDTELETLGAALAEATTLFPLDVPPPQDAVLLWDTEWKITSTGRLVIKQIRPLLLD
jgi:hypothetical protein